MFLKPIPSRFLLRTHVIIARKRLDLSTPNVQLGTRYPVTDVRKNVNVVIVLYTQLCRTTCTCNDGGALKACRCACDWLTCGVYERWQKFWSCTAVYRSVSIEHNWLLSGKRVRFLFDLPNAIIAIISTALLKTDKKHFFFFYKTNHSAIHVLYYAARTASVIWYIRFFSVDRYLLLVFGYAGSRIIFNNIVAIVQFLYFFSVLTFVISSILLCL